MSTVLRTSALGPRARKRRDERQAVRNAHELRAANAVLVSLRAETELLRSLEETVKLEVSISADVVRALARLAAYREGVRNAPK